MVEIEIVWKKHPLEILISIFFLIFGLLMILPVVIFLVGGGFPEDYTLYEKVHSVALALFGLVIIIMQYTGKGVKEKE